METRRGSPLRLLAPVALALFVLLFFVVITSSDVSHHSAGSSKHSSTKHSKKTTSQKANHLPQTVYTVKTGDTLASISVKVGVPVEKLQQLNPDLDPQALVSGQKIKLR
jgi:LysM repeat protein